MNPRGLLILVPLVVACAGGNDPAESGTDIGSGGTMGDGSTSTGQTPDPSTTTMSIPEPTTAESSSSGDAESSSTGAGSTTEDGSSTGAPCPAGTEGCPCDTDDVCDDGLACTADVCVVPLCPDDEDEPNDDPFEPQMLMDLSDNDDPVVDGSQLAGDADTDWFRFSCDDPFTSSSEPNIDVTVPEGTRTCLFLDCLQGGNPFFTCPDGTEDANAPIDNLPGCCITDSGAFEISTYMCPDSSEDAVNVYLRVEDGPAETCSDYDFTYGC